VFCVSLDQAVGVPPQYPDDPFITLNKASVIPPLSMSPPIFLNYFPHYNIAFGSKCLLPGLEYPTSCIRNLLPLPVSFLIPIGLKCWPRYVYLLCICLAMLSLDDYRSGGCFKCWNSDGMAGCDGK
jgi:hypothetical protein